MVIVNWYSSTVVPHIADSGNWYKSISGHAMMYRLPDESITGSIGIIQRIITMYQLAINVLNSGYHFMFRLADIRSTRFYCISVVRHTRLPQQIWEIFSFETDQKFHGSVFMTFPSKYLPFFIKCLVRQFFKINKYLCLETDFVWIYHFDVGRIKSVSRRKSLINPILYLRVFIYSLGRSYFDKMH